MKNYDIVRITSSGVVNYVFTVCGTEEQAEKLEEVLNDMNVFPGVKIKVQPTSK